MITRNTKWTIRLQERPLRDWGMACTMVGVRVVTMVESKGVGRHGAHRNPTPTVLLGAQAVRRWSVTPNLPTIVFGRSPERGRFRTAQWTTRKTLKKELRFRVIGKLTCRKEEKRSKYR